MADPPSPGGPTDTADFVEPDWDAPLDVDAVIAAVPEHARVRGMFFTRLLEELQAYGQAMHAFGPYRAFTEYPLSDLILLEVETARAIHDGLPIREGLRRLGWLGYPTFLNSLIGRIIFGVLGDNLPAIFRTASKGYGASLNVGHAAVIESSDNHAIIRLTQMYNFPDCYQVGVLEGVFRHYKREGEILIRDLGNYNIDLLAKWP